MINHTTTGTAIVRDERRRRRLGSIAFKAQAPITRVVLGDGRSGECVLLFGKGKGRGGEI